MSEIFPPIHEGPRVNPQMTIDPVPRVETQVSENYRVYNDKQVIDTEVLTLYTKDGTVNTVRDTARTIDLLI